MIHVITEKDYGEFKFRGEEYKLKTSFHTHSKRGKIPRDSLTKTKYVNIITKGESIIKNEKSAIIWEWKDGYYKGLLVVQKGKTILIITTILTAKNKNPDKLFPNITNRINIGKL